MFGPTVSRMLEDARLDPKDLESLVLAAIEEDLDGGVDRMVEHETPVEKRDGPGRVSRHDVSPFAHFVRDRRRRSDPAALPC